MGEGGEKGEGRRLRWPGGDDPLLDLLAKGHRRACDCAAGASLRSVCRPGRQAKARSQNAKDVTLPLGDRRCGHGFRPPAEKKCARPENPFPARMISGCCKDWAACHALEYVKKSAKGFDAGTRRGKASLRAYRQPRDAGTGRHSILADANPPASERTPSLQGLWRTSFAAPRPGIESALPVPPTRGRIPAVPFTTSIPGSRLPHDEP